MIKPRDLICVVVLLIEGCAGPGQFFPGLHSKAQDWNVKTVESKGRAGPEFRQDSNGAENERWTAQTGFEATTHNGHKWGVEYRRRDINDGAGRNDGHDDGVWLTWSFPVWNDTSRPNKEAELEKRIAELEKRLKD